MRLLDVHSLEVVQVPDDGTVPYAILSHTWGTDEVSFREMRDFDRKTLNSARTSLQWRKGLMKILDAKDMAIKDGYQHIWIDTCCIDKTSSAELSEAINSMYQWYQRAGICYAYLSDVPDLSALEFSRWFMRGWTLQELIAPREVRFYGKDWIPLGSKQKDISLLQTLSSITGVDGRILRGQILPEDVSVADRMRWAAMRETTRIEDTAYSLMGLFNVNMPLLYGEGSKAFIRLQEEILRATDDQSIFAWSVPKHQTHEGQLWGLLAESPSCFGQTPSVQPLPPLLSQDSAPWDITNQGLRVQLFLSPYDKHKATKHQEEYMAILDCSWIDPLALQGWRLVIYMVRLWGNQFARIRADTCARIPDVDPKSTNKGSYETLFVKQKPAFTPPSFLVAPKHLENPPRDTPWLLEEVCPPELWDAQNGLLKSTLTRVGGINGIFRFKTTKKKIDVIVSLVRTAQGQWDANYSLKDYNGTSLLKTMEYAEMALRGTEVLGDRQDDVVMGLTQQEYELPVVPRIVRTTMFGRTYFKLDLHIITELEDSPPKKESAELSGYTRGEVQRNLDELFAEDVLVDSPLLSAFPSHKPEAQIRCSSPGIIAAKVEAWKDIIMSTPTRSPGANPQISTLLEASKRGNNTTVQSILDASVATTRKVEYQSAFHRFRPIHWATACGHVSVVQTLLDAGANCEATTKEGLTALHLASMLGYYNIAEVLLSSETRVLEDDQPWLSSCVGTMDTPFHFAAAYCSGRDFELLVDTALAALNTSSQAHTLLFPSLLSSRDYLEATPLHRAAAMGNVDTVQYLVSEWPECVGTRWTVDCLGRTPLWYAACGGHSDIVNILMKTTTGISAINFADDSGITPLHVACRQGHEKCVSELLRSGADLLAITNFPGLTIAYYAALTGHTKCLEALEKAALQLSDPSRVLDCQTYDIVLFKPIQLAQENGRAECVKILEKYSTLPDSAYRVANLCYDDYAPLSSGRKKQRRGD